MNQEDIIHMARIAGVRDDGHRFEFSEYKYLERFAELVRADTFVKPCCGDFVDCQQVCMPRAAAQEREACAKVCYELPWKDMGHIPSNLAFAAAIRARGQA